MPILDYLDTRPGPKSFSAKAQPLREEAACVAAMEAFSDRGIAVKSAGLDRDLGQLIITFDSPRTTGKRA